MVKGVQKRVVVVRCPDGKYFDQAIFMVRDQSLTESGQSPEQVLEEACRAADSYLRKNVENRRRYFPWVLGGVTALCVLAILLFL
jgi:hypothetical protein